MHGPVLPLTDLIRPICWVLQVCKADVGVISTSHHRASHSVEIDIVTGKERLPQQPCACIAHIDAVCTAQDGGAVGRCVVEDTPDVLRNAEDGRVLTLLELGLRREGDLESMLAERLKLRGQG